MTTSTPRTDAIDGPRLAEATPQYHALLDLARTLERELAAQGDCFSEGVSKVREEVRQAYEDDRVRLQAKVNLLTEERGDLGAAVADLLIRAGRWGRQAGPLANGDVELDVPAMVERLASFPAADGPYAGPCRGAEGVSLFEPTEEQWSRMVELQMARPIPLTEADTSRPFIYSREHGLMYTPMGYHNAAMATLYAWRLGKESYIDLLHLFTRLPYEAADAFIEFVPGGAFRSSMSSKVQVWNTAKLTPAERRAFGTACSIDPTLD